MTIIERDLKKCSKKHYDLIIVGGGVYGVMLSYEAARRNLRSLMLEKNDFCSATTQNHLRTIHGGMRHLQNADLPRFYDSVGERKWFLKYFPEFVNPMPCLMPIYNKGIYKKPILRSSILVNDILSVGRNRAIIKEKRLPSGKIISARWTRNIFPSVDDRGLKGGVIWYDSYVKEYNGPLKLDSELSFF